MDKLWQKRTPPKPLEWDKLGSETSEVVEDAGIPDKRIWSMEECGRQFQLCVMKLKEQMKNSDEPLVWDKDEPSAMDFVVATSNIRSHIFHIPEKSRFDIKSISGNIIPAIASTNAIIAGLMVVEALKILSGKLDECRTVYLNKQVKTRNRLITQCKLEKPNEKCYVCAAKPEVIVYLDTTTVTIHQLEYKIFKEKLGMVAPDVEIDDGKGTILISSEEGETEGNWGKVLSDFKITDGSRLKADDFLQNFKLVVNIRLKKDIEPPDFFLMEGDLPTAPEEEKPAVDLTASERSAEVNGTTGTRKRRLSDSELHASSKKSKSESNDTENNNAEEVSRLETLDTNTVESDDDIIML